MTTLGFQWRPQEMLLDVLLKSEERITVIGFVRNLTHLE